MDTLRTPSLFARFIAAPTTVAVALTPALATPPALRIVALSGQAAAGTPSGTRFEQFDAGEFDGAPAMGADSTMAFAAILTDETAGFWLDRGSGPELLAHSGSPAPGAEPGVVFSQRISETVIFTPPMLVPGHTVLRNTLTGPGVGFNNDDGIWTSGGSGLALLTREGAAAPGLAGVQTSTINLQAIDQNGRSIVSALLTGAVVDGNNESIWRAAPGAQLELLAREGSAAPGAGFGVVFASSSSPSAFPIITGNGPGHLLFEGDLHGPGTGTGNDEALFIRDDAGTRLFLREGDPVPGMPGFVFRSGFTAGFHLSDISFGDDDHIAVTARVGNGTQTLSVLLSDAAGPLTVLARTGDPAPGTNGSFDLIVSPVRNGRGDVAFLASSPNRLDLGLWIRSAGGLRAVAVPDQPVPDAPAGTTLQSIQSINGFNNSGVLLFTAVLTLPGGLSSTALIAADPSGGLSIVARTGGTITVAPGDTRTVSQIAVRQHALSDDAHAAFAVHFTGFSGAEVVATLGGACYANCDASTAAPVLNANDFQCFLNQFASGASYANCDGSTSAPVLNANDFQCFLNAFAAGCP